MKYNNIIILIIIFIIISLQVVLIKSNNITYPQRINQERAELFVEGAKDTLVKEIDNYIQKRTKGKSSLNGLALVNACNEYNIDIIFVIAQAEIEGHFATKGLATKYNSVFNVGAFDGKGGKHMKKYEHPDLSIQPYLELLTKKYLVNGITEEDLMKKYVDCDGHRYASDKQYENKLHSKYNYIINNTNIDYLYQRYKKYCIIANK